ncbi:MAG: DinB family protein [Phycisphaerae bacterium]
MRDRALAHARFAHGMINKFAEGFAPEQVVAQAGACPNHLLWTLGHLASSASWTHGMITGASPIVPEGYHALFGMGSKPIGDAALYPSFDEVRQAYEATFQRIVDAVARLDDQDLLTPPEQESGGFITDKLDALNKLAWHEGWHLGQLSDLRRGLGLPHVF